MRNVLQQKYVGMLQVKFDFGKNRKHPGNDEMHMSSIYIRVYTYTNKFK